MNAPNIKNDKKMEMPITLSWLVHLSMFVEELHCVYLMNMFNYCMLIKNLKLRCNFHQEKLKPINEDNYLDICRLIL